MKPQVREGVTLREEKWGAIVFDKWFEKVYEINSDGLRIMILCDGKHKIEDIATELSRTTGISTQDLRIKIKEFIWLLRNELLLYDAEDATEISLIRTKRDRICKFPRVFDDIDHLTKKPNRGLLRHYKTLSAPLLVTLDVTSNCNLRCKYCYNRSGFCDPHELTTVEIIDLIDELAAIGVYWLPISGGEPLLKEGIFDIIRHAVERGLSVTLTTNGTLVTREIADKLADTGLERVQVSIDSKDPHIHDSLRGKGSHALATQGLKNLLSSRIRYIGVATVATKLNLADIPNLIDWLEGLGVSLLRIMRFMPLGRGSEQKRLELNKEEILELFSIISRKQLEMKSLLIRVSDAYKAMLAEKALYTCNAAKTWCAVDSNGYVFPCTLMISPDNREILDVENIRSKPLKDIWMNNKLFEDLRGVEKIEGTCRKCDKLELCQGGCRSYALAKCGNVFDSDPICSYLRG